MSGVGFVVRASRPDWALEATLESGAGAIALVGPSGAGKSSLLMALAGLLPGAQVRLDVAGLRLVDTAAGLDPAPHHRGVGYVFQDARLFPHLSVGRNIGFGRPYAENPMSVGEALALVDLEGFEERRPATLSGGEARRAALARALLVRPKLLLLDEPFSGLDGARRLNAIAEIRRLRERIATPLILVSHDERDVQALAEQVLVIENGRLKS